MKTVRPLPAATTQSATATTRRMPNCSMRAAANGAVSPNSSRSTLTASETVAVDQPSSSCSGRISTPGVARPADATSATNATPATHHARWTLGRVLAGAAGAVTPGRLEVHLGQDGGLGSGAGEVEHDVLGRHRAAEVPALPGRAAPAGEQLGALGVLDALGDDPQAQ